MLHLNIIMLMALSMSLNKISIYIETNTKKNTKSRVQNLYLDDLNDNSWIFLSTSSYSFLQPERGKKCE